MNKLALKVCILFVALSLSACNAEKILNAAIDHERSSAGLSLKSSDLSFGKITYLENDVKSDAAIVLLHGFGGDKDTWVRLVAELEGKHRVIVPDLAGHAESVLDLNINYSISNQAQMLATFLDSIGVKKVYLAGNSMGGAVALKYSVAYPENTLALILIDSLGLIKTESDYDNIVKTTGENPMLNVCTEEQFETLLNIGMNEFPYIPGIFMDTLVERKCAKSKIEKKVYDDMLKDSDLTAIVKQVSAPTLILWGDKDRVLHPDNAQLFAQSIKGSELMIFEGAGHVLPLEMPEKAAEAIEAFINE